METIFVPNKVHNLQSSQTQAINNLVKTQFVDYDQQPSTANLNRQIKSFHSLRNKIQHQQFSRKASLSSQVAQNMSNGKLIPKQNVLDYLQKMKKSGPNFMIYSDLQNSPKNLDQQYKKRQLTGLKQRNRKTQSCQSLNQMLEFDPNTQLKSRLQNEQWVYTQQLIHSPSNQTSQKKEIVYLSDFITRQKILQKNLYKDKLDLLQNKSYLNYNGSKNIMTSDSPQPQLQPKSAKLSSKYGIKPTFNKPSSMEKQKFSDFYQDNIEKIMNFKDGRKFDNYEKLEKDLLIDSLQYVQVAKHLDQNPVLEKLLNDRVVERIDDVKKLFQTAQDLEEQEKQYNRKQKSEKKLLIEYRHKCSVEEIVGDAVYQLIQKNQQKDEGQIKSFIGRVLEAQKKMVSEFDYSLKPQKIKASKSKSFLNIKTKTKTLDLYNCVATKFFLKTSKDQNKQIIKLLKSRLQRIWILDLTLKEVVIEQEVFSNRPFQRNGSKEFFDQLKLASFEEIEKTLHKNPWLINDFDFNHSTPLHFAAKRGDLQLTKLFLEYKSDLDAIDYVGKTCLFYAMKNGYDQIAIILLVKGANPWSNTKNPLNKLEMFNEVKIRVLFTRARRVKYKNYIKKINLMLKMSPFKTRKRLQFDLLSVLQTYI